MILVEFKKAKPFQRREAKAEFTCPFAGICKEAKKKQTTCASYRDRDVDVDVCVTRRNAAKPRFVNLETGYPVRLLTDQEALEEALGTVKKVYIY